MADSAARPEKRRKVDRVVAACDLCKRRKVKCDGVCDEPVLVYLVIVFASVVGSRGCVVLQ
jgi:hypothetical protein